MSLLTSDAINQVLYEELNLPKVLIFLVRKYINIGLGTSLEDVKRSLQEGCSLWSIPIELRTRDLCFIAVQKTPHNIAFIPEEFITEKISLTVMRRDGVFLQLIPEEKRTYNVCLMAVINNPRAKIYVPEYSRLDYELWINKGVYEFFNWVRSFCPERNKYQ